jgi:predicted alpha/beta superfamily hydrolase
MQPNRRFSAASRRRTAVPVLILSLASGSLAQTTPAGRWKEIVLHSKTLGLRTIYVATPDGYQRGNRRYPVLVLLDADDQPGFRLGIAQAAYLADNSDVPPMIVVGIVNGDDRLHDMTPAPTGSSVAEFKTAGGAPAFADFIFHEVLPMVRTKYRALPTTVLAGHSAGGLFALYSAATSPGRYQGVIAMDPAIWFNDGRLANEYADAIASSTTRQRIFTAHGGGSPDKDIDTTTRRFAWRLDSIKPPSVAFAHRRYPDDTHELVPLAAFPDGLRFVFEPVSTERLPIATLDDRADSARLVKALAASESSYADSARSLLLEQQLPEPTLNRLARFALDALKDPALSLLVFERSVELHPQSARAMARLAEAYLANGDTASAIAHFRKAVAMSPSSATELPSDARAMLKKLERKRVPNLHLP